MLKLHFINSGKSVLTNPLVCHQDGISLDFQRACDQVDEYISLDGVKYSAYYLPKMWSPVGGSAPDSHTINLSFNPAASSKFDRSQLFPIYLAHERHHVLRHRGPGYGTTWGESLVSEGLGVLSEHEMARKLGLDHHPLARMYEGEMWHPYTIDQEEISKYIKLSSPHLSARLSSKLWTELRRNIDVYTFGYWIVGQYQKQQNMPTAIDMAHTPALQILGTVFSQP